MSDRGSTGASSRRMMRPESTICCFCQMPMLATARTSTPPRMTRSLRMRALRSTAEHPPYDDPHDEQDQSSTDEHGRLRKQRHMEGVIEIGEIRQEREDPDADERAVAAAES